MTIRRVRKFNRWKLNASFLRFSFIPALQTTPLLKHSKMTTVTTKTTATMSSLTKQLSNLDLAGKDKSTARAQPVLHKKTSSSSTMKLASKYALTKDGNTGAGTSAGMSAAVKAAVGGAGSGSSSSTTAVPGHKRVNSTATKPTTQLARTNTATSTTSGAPAAAGSKGSNAVQRSRTNSTATTASTTRTTASRAPTPASQALNMDIGQYDGGFEIENEKRGSAVHGEAAEILALDSSFAV